MLSRKEYIIKRFKEIIEAKENNNISVFIGAGISKLSGSLTWGELTNGMMEELGIIEESAQEKFRKEYTSMAVAQMYEEKFGVNTYEAFIKNKLGISLSENKVMKRIIKELKPQNFITTNYDNVIENELTDMGLINTYDIIKEDCDFANSKVNKKIVKMHGSLDKNNMVLKETDYLEYSENFKLIETTVKSIIAGNKVIFFGYSLQDNNVRQIINWIKTLTKNNSNMPILFLVNRPIEDKEEEDKITFKLLSDDEINYYKKIGVDVIQFNELESVFDKKIYVEKMKNNEHFEYAYTTFFDYLSYIEKNKNISTEEKLKALYLELKEVTKDKYIRLEDCKNLFKKYEMSYHSGIITIDNKELLKLFQEYINGKDSENKQMVKFIVEFIFSRAGKIDNFYLPKDIDIRNGIIIDGTKNIETIMNENKEENSIKENLRKAYYYFYNGKTEEARNLYNKVKKICREQKNVFFYVVAIVNEYVCDRVMNRWVISEMKEELDEALENLPGEVKNKYSFINEIIDFKITNKQIKYYKNLEKYYKEVYNGKNIMRFGNIEFIELIDLYNCIKENYLLIDVFNDISNIFRVYAEGEVIRYIYKEKYKVESDEFFIDSIFDTSSQIETQKLKWILEYSDLNFMKDYFNIFINFNLNEKDNKEIVEYTLKYIKHLLDIQNNQVMANGITVSTKMLSTICFLQAFSLNKDQTGRLLELVLQYRSINKDCIIYILNILNKLIGKVELDYEKINKLCYKEIEVILKGRYDNKTSKIYYFMKYRDIKINNEQCSKIFNDYSIDDKNCEVFFQIMPYLSNSLKKQVIKYCNDKLKENEKMEIISQIAEYDLPIDISEFNQFVSNYFADDDNWTNIHEDSNGGKSFNNDKYNTVHYIECMRDKLTQKQKDIIISKDEMYKFYFNYETFDYNDFDARYLLNATPNFILQVTENEKNKNIIIDKIALAINETSNQYNINMYVKILKIINSRDEKYYYI